MDNRDRDNGDRKGKKVVSTSESKIDVVYKRHMLGQRQFMILVASYLITPHPSSEVMLELALATHLSYREVEDWFKNRRFTKQQKTYETGESSSSAGQPTVDHSNNSSPTIQVQRPSQNVNMIVHPPVWQGGMLEHSGVGLQLEGVEASMQDHQHSEPGVGQGPSKDAQDETVEATPNLEILPSSQGEGCTGDVDEESHDVNQGCDDFPGESPNSINEE